MSPPCSPIGETTPRTTSSTRRGSKVGLRTLISSRRPTARSTGLTSCSEPTFLPLPRGVRTWSYTNASAMTVLSESCLSRPLSIVTPLLSPWSRWPHRGPDHPSVELRRGGVGRVGRAAAGAAHPGRADQPRRHERPQRPLLHHQGVDPAADPARTFRLLHPRPYRSA